MSSGLLPTTISDESDTAFDLSTVFSHPAGLRVARYVVGTYIRAAQNTLPPPTAETTSHPVPISAFESSPEVTSLLQTILALNDSEVQTSERDDARLEEFSMEGHRNELSVRDYPSAFDFSQPDLYSSKSKQTTNDFFATSNTSLSANSSRSSTNHSSILSDSLHNSLMIHSRSQIDLASRPFNLNSHPGFGGSLTPGSDSPYRIESPSRTSTNNTPQPQHSQSSRALLPAADPFTNADIFATRLPPLRKSLSTDSAGSNGASGPAPRGYSSGLGHIVTTASSSSIKSFMPVNKTPEGNLVAKPFANENLAFSDRATFHTSGMTPNASAQHTPISTALCRSLSAQHPFSANSQGFEMERTPSGSGGQKRKGEVEQYGTKREKAEKGVKRILKLKEIKAEPAAHKLGADLWMRILEFTPPSFIRKARLLNRDFKTWIDEYSSIFVNQRLENYGVDMPPASAIQIYLNFDDDEAEATTAVADIESTTTPNPSETQIVQVVKKKSEISERQYNDLLGGKGCLEKGKDTDGQKVSCQDEKASRTHWSWAQRWCWDCWKAKIEREDRILKTRQNSIGRQTLLDLLACIPNGMHDSFLKPHDYVTEEESRERPRGAPRLYRYYLKQDVDSVIAEYNKRTPLPYVDDPSLTPAANASAKAVHQIKETSLIQKRQDWVDKMKLKNAAWMETVKKIEAAVRKRREENGRPHEDYRAARKELFTRRAKEDLPHIPTDFVERTKAYKAATRIFRDGGTERGWQTLKPKIENEWKEEEKKKSDANIENEENERMEVEDATNSSFELETNNLRPNTNVVISYNGNNITNPHLQQIADMQRAQRAQHHHHALIQAAQRVQQQAPMANMSSVQNRQSFMSRYRVNSQHSHSLGVLAAAAAADFSMSSAFNGYGTGNNFQTQSSSQHSQTFPSNAMRYDHRSQNGSQFQYAQYPSTNVSNMCQNTPNQEPTRTGLTIGDLLAAEDPSNAIYKPSQSHHPTQQHNASQHHNLY